jgi:hypothetical protein
MRIFGVNVLKLQTLIILEMFLQLDWIPPVVNSIDWTLLRKAHTCLQVYTAKTKP